jgi:hypothetical protein
MSFHSLMKTKWKVGVRTPNGTQENGDKIAPVVGMYSLGAKKSSIGGFLEYFGD